MRKICVLLITLCLLTVCAAANADLLFPTQLTEIGPEAFAGDSALVGLVCLPDQIRHVGANDFTGAALYALDVPEGTVNLDSQALNGAAYIRLRGSDTTIDALSGVRMVIAPENSAAKEAVIADGIHFVDGPVLEQDNFYYLCREDGSAEMLCAVDATLLSGIVNIPSAVDGHAVASISADAFTGFDQVRDVYLPDTLANAVLPNTDAELHFHDDQPLAVTRVSANAAAGTVGESIRWTADVYAVHAVAGYEFTLKKNGVAIETEISETPEFEYTAEDVGAYQLLVTVRDSAGNVAEGKSKTLYIAVEAMTMDAPETLINGQDLIVSVQEAAGAIGYGVYVTEEATGQSVYTWSSSEPGVVTVRGFQMNAGDYRITGYVYGNDYRYSVPTVATVSVSGEKAEGPAFPEQDPVSAGRELQLRLSETEPFAIRYQYRYSDGVKSRQYTGWSNGEASWIGVYDEEESWSDGGAILAQWAARQDGVWTDWGPVTEIAVQPRPRLEKPKLTVAETAVAGKDMTVSFDNVEHAEYYDLSVYRGNQTGNEGEWSDSVYFAQYRKGGTVFVPGYVLDSGIYTVRVSAWADRDYESNEALAVFTAEGLRPDAPQVTPNKTERFLNSDELRLAISAPGAEGAYIQRIVMKNGYIYTRFGMESIALDENGEGVYRDREDLSDNEDFIGATFIYQVATIQDGIWSSWYAVDVLMKQREALAAPRVEAPAELASGQDFIFTFQATEEAETYRASVYRAYSTDTLYSWNSDSLKPDTEIVLPGHYLTQGNYRLVVVAQSSERMSSETECLFAVSGIRSAAPAVARSAEEAHILEKLTFSIDTAGAEELYVTYTGSKSGQNWRYSDRRSIAVTEDTTDWSYTFNQDALGMLFTFQFSVKKDGLWSAWRAVEMTVQDAPDLAKAVIHAPEALEAGQDFALSFDAVEHADQYRTSLYLGEEQLWSSWDQQPRQWELTGYDYEPGTYRLIVRADGEGFGSSTAEAVFSINGQKPAAPTASPDRTAVVTGGEFTFTIDAAGAEEIYYVSQKESGRSSGTIKVLDEPVIWTTSQYYAGEYAYRFCAYREGRWTAFCEPIQISVSDGETLPEPAVTVPEEIPAGGDLTVQVGGVPNATWYYVYLYNSRNRQIGYRSINGAAGGEVTFEGYLLPVGNVRIETTANANVGSSKTTRTVTVKANSRPDAPTVQAETDTGRVSTYFSFTVASEGADQIAVRSYRDGNTNDVTYRTADATEAATVWRDSKGTSGYVWNYAFAVRVNGIWSGWSDTKRVVITDREQLQQAEITVPQSAEAGQDVYVSFTGVENADYYNLYLYRPDGRTESWTVHAGTERRIVGYDLIPGSYRVAVRAIGAGYEESRAERSFTATGERAAFMGATVDKESVYTEETFTFVIPTAGAEEAAYRYNTDDGVSSSGTLNVLADSTVWETSSYYAGVRNYSFAVLKNGRWSAWSTPIAVTIKGRPSLDEPQIVVPASISQGSNLTVSIAEAKDIAYYDVSLYNNRGQTTDSRHLDQAGNAVFYGCKLTPGVYRVAVNAYGVDNGRSAVSAVVTVEAANLSDAPAVIPPENTMIARQTYFSFEIDTADAELAVVRSYRIGAPNDVSYSTFAVSSGETTTWRSYLYSGGRTYAYSFAVCWNGRWSQWSDFTEIVVE